MASDRKNMEEFAKRFNLPAPEPYRSWKFGDWSIGQNQFFIQDCAKAAHAAHCWNNRSSKKFMARRSFENGEMGMRIWRIK